MNTEERTALEALAGRALTAEDDAVIDAALPGRRDDLIAAHLSDGRTKIGSHFASERGILERYPLGPIEADALLASLEAFAATAHPMARIVGRALKFLAMPEGLDIGSPATLGLLDQLMAGGVLTQTQRDGLRQMATVPDPITTNQVSDALNRAQGLMPLEG
jgi:hypothetical protein